MLKSGIPLQTEYGRLESEPAFEALLRYSREFESRCRSDSQSMRRYGSKWVKDPFLQWSRRWEYVYVAQRVTSWAETRPAPLKVVDAGSGFTFFPFYLLQASPGLDIDCYDTDPTAGEALAEAADMLGVKPGFRIEDLESLRQEDNSIDIVYSVSVIEHTRHPQTVIDEVCRVLKPGGLFVCTFDISFDNRSPMHVRHVAKLAAHLGRRFSVASDWPDIDFGALPSDNDIVTTGWVASTQAAPLPWRQPRLVWLYDLLRGRPRATLYRPMTFCCGTFTKR